MNAPSSSSFSGRGPAVNCVTVLYTVALGSRTSRALAMVPLAALIVLLQVAEGLAVVPPGHHALEHHGS
jgi:hypothetical protein